jgi:purine-binding chemotaxis protein CheW
MKANGRQTHSHNGGNGKSSGAGYKKALASESLDWDRMRQRLSTLGNLSAEEELDTLSPEMVEEVWAQRAVQVAQVPSSEETSDLIEVVLLRVGRELLGIEVDYITAIRQNEPVTRVPRVPAWVLGVVNLRGSILSVIDLRIFLGLPAALQEDHTDSAHEKKNGLLVVTATREMQMVLMVDDVPGVQALRVKDIHNEASILRGIRPEYVRGIVERHTQVNGEERADPVIIVNIEALLSDRRMIIFEEPV